MTDLEKSRGCVNPGLEHIGDFYEWFCAVKQPDILAKGVIDIPAHLVHFFDFPKRKMDVHAEFALLHAEITLPAGG